MRGTTAAAAALLLLTAGCGWGGTDGDGDDGTTLTVLAASSLTDVFEELAADFEAEHEGVDVELVFGSSTDLAEQAADGAPVDVLATADRESMQLAVEAGVIGNHGPFASNELVLVTPAANPAGITSLDDLDGATWVRCADEAPCGKVAVAVLAANEIDAEPASLEEDARTTLDKVVAGEADAALVYASDARSAGDEVTTVRIPGSAEHRATYLIGTPTVMVPDEDASASGAEALAQEFLLLVLGETGRAALTDAGFGLP